MAFENIASSFGGIVSAVKVMLTALPIGQDDKARIDGILTDLETAADSIAKQAGGKITVRKSDVIAAVETVLPALVEAAVSAALEKLAVDTPANDPVTIAGETIVKND